MSVNSAFRVSVLPGDGIGAEVIDPTVEILKKLQGDIGGFELSFGSEKAGAAHYVETGTALPEDAMRGDRRPTLSCLAPWACRRSAIRAGARSRRNWTCARNLSCSLTCVWSRPGLR